MGSLPAGIQHSAGPGVPTYWRSSDEPFVAWLAFRVGRADEALRTGGITHAVEHLAMSAVTTRRIEANAFVEALRTVFFATGDQDRVLQFLIDIAAALEDLPVDRLDAELGVLQAEADGSSGGAAEGMLVYRYGAQGHGLLGYEEIGFSCLTAPDIRSWAAERFVAGNAVLSMTAPPPPDFRLDLPPGPWRPPPPVVPMNFAVPAALRDGDEAVVLSAVGVRCPALASGTRIAQQRLHDALRTRRGRSYEIISDYEPLNVHEAYWLAAAVGRPEHAREVTATFWSTLEHLAADGPHEEELNDEIEENRAFLNGARDRTGLLLFLADGHLIEGGPVDLTKACASNEALDARAISTAVSDALTTALLLTPETADPPVGFNPYPLHSETVVDGPRFAGRGAKNAVLIVGPKGISATSDGRNHVTIPWDECEVVLRWPNGDRAPMGRDGMRIRVCSGQWKDGFLAVQEIDRHAPPSAVVYMRPEMFPAGGWMVEREGEGELFAAPSWDHDGWALIDLSRFGGADGLPSLAPEPELAALDVGDRATVLLTVRGDDGLASASESLIVMVASAKHEFYAGTLEHASTLVPRLGPSAAIAFSAHHVAETSKRRFAGKAWRSVLKVTNR